MIKFLYDIDKDAENWVDTVKNTRPSWGINYGEETKMVPDDLKGKILRADDKEAIKLVKSYFRSQSRFNSKKEFLSSEIEAVKEAWNGKEKSFFRIIEDLTKKPLFSRVFTAYFTTMFICPYDEEKYKWFMLSMWHSLPFQITTICHEIFHFQFLYYYADFCREEGLNENQLENIKEALTSLLNTEEFDDIILSQDPGYSNHQAIRQRILDVWQKDKLSYLKDKNGFEVFLKRIIKDIK